MIRSAVALACAVILSGCAYTDFAQQAIQQEQARHVPTDLGERTYRTVDQMIDEARVLVATQSPAVVGSIADIRDVNRSTPFGNIIADLVRTRLVQDNLPVSDMRMREAVKLDPTQGELMLSRDRKQVYQPPGASEIVTGTYAVANDNVYVSLKMIETDNARILAAADYVVPRTQDVDRLLMSGFASLR